MSRPSFDEGSIRFDVYLPGGQNLSLPDRAGESGARRVLSSKVDDRDRPARNLVQVRANGRNRAFSLCRRWPARGIMSARLLVLLCTLAGQ